MSGKGAHPLHLTAVCFRMCRVCFACLLRRLAHTRALCGPAAGRTPAIADAHRLHWSLAIICNPEQAVKRFKHHKRLAAEEEKAKRMTTPDKRGPSFRHMMHSASTVVSGFVQTIGRALSDGPARAVLQDSDDDSGDGGDNGSASSDADASDGNPRRQAAAGPDTGAALAVDTADVPPEDVDFDSDDEDADVPCILFMDSLGVHDADKNSALLYTVLNKEYQRRNSTSDAPFTREFMPWTKCQVSARASVKHYYGRVLAY